MKKDSRMPLSGEKGFQRKEYLYMAVLTALLFLLMFCLFNMERKRTLRGALDGMESGEDVISFSEESGFFSEGFTLKLEAAEKIPRDSSIEIRYTLNGDEPTDDSPLYEDGIDLTEACAASLQAAQAQEQERQAAVEEAKALAAQAQEAAAAEEAARNAGNEEQGDEEEPARNADNEEQEPAEGTSQGDGDGGQEETPGLEEGRRTWQQEKWTSASDDGVYPERTQDGICVIPVRACLIQGEDRSPVVTRTYVIGLDVAERWQDVYIASITIDSASLFDYDLGIMVKGSHYQKDVENGVRADRAGNFYQEGDDWTKDGHVTLFSQDGEVLMEEDAGMEVSGYSSRILPTKSLRAVASPEHGSSDSFFTLDIFSTETGEAGAGTVGTEEETDGAMAETGGPEAENISALEDAAVSVEKTDGAAALSDSVSRFRKIKFRTHGVPTYHIRSVRNEYAKRLSDDCGFPGMTENRLGVVFLNGEFYTVCDITPSADKDFLCALFGLNVRDAVEKYSGSDVDVYTKAKILKLFTADLTDPVNQKALEEAVDMDNYLFYFALEVLFNNADWPYNNMTIWRYLGNEDPENPCTDGRIRYVLDDMDQILTNGLHGDPARWSDELINYLMKDKGATFYHVMQCKKYRDTFLTYVDDLLSTSFSPDYACSVLEELYAGMEREYLLDYGEDYWAEMENTASVTMQNVREKEALYRADITEYMGLTDRYSVRIEADEGVSVRWNNDCGTSPYKRIQQLAPGGAWSNEYYRGTSFTAEASVEEGYRFAGWEVNGELLADGSALTDGTAQAEPSTAIAVSDGLLPEGETSVLTLRAVAVKE